MKLPPGNPTSFYVFDPEVFWDDWHAFTSSFRSLLPRTIVSLSVKTCPLAPLLQAGRSWGSWAEVVSLAEYRYVRHLGWPPDQIIVNGPVKSPDFLGTAWNEGALVQIDSEAEIDWLLHGKNKPSGLLRCGLRCQVDLLGESSSRFGFPIASGDAAKALTVLSQIPHVAIESLHVHQCTKTRSPKDYYLLAQALLRFAKEHFPADRMPNLNLGGGFLSPSAPSFRAQFPFEWADFGAYAEAIAQALVRGDPNPARLIVEPGMAVMARCLSFYCRISGLKTVAGQPHILCEGSCYNIKPSKSRRNFPVCIHPTGLHTRTKVNQAVVAGYTCMEDDIMHRGLTDHVAVGDYIEFREIGAYSIALKPPFIEPAPPVYLKSSGGELALAVPAQTWQEMMRCDSPERSACAIPLNPQS
jgi:diaminopimelate decarboxylase